MSEKKILHIEVRDKIARLVNQDEFLVCGNSDYEVHFDFDEVWNGHFAKTALFVFGDTTVDQPFTGNVCKGVEITKATKCFIGVFTGDIITTTKADVKCFLSIRDIAKTPKAPEEDVYNKIIELINNIPIVSGGGGIVEVDELPNDDISNTIFYKTPEGLFYFDKEWKGLSTINDVINLINDSIKGKQDAISFDGEYDAETNKAATVQTVLDKISDIIAGAPEDFDTLKELADWLSTHGKEAAEMNSAIEEATSIANEAKEIAGQISGIATQSLTIANRAFEESEKTTEQLEAEISRATDADTDLEGLVNREKARAIEAENELSEKLDEVDSLAKGATKSIAYGDYATMITAFNNFPNGIYKVGQGILIGTVNVPDLWVFAENAINRPYTYTSDDNFTNELKENGTIQVGYYVLSALETQKVDLRDYVNAYISESKLINKDWSGASVYFGDYIDSPTTLDMRGAAYLSYDQPLSREQLIGAKVYGNYVNYNEPTTHTITADMIAEETADGMWIKVSSSVSDLKYIFVAYTENYRPSCMYTNLPKVGVYFSSWGYYDNPYIESLEAIIRPAKKIDNRLIDLKNHPDFIIPEPDMVDYVKNTDYASGEKAGVFKLGENMTLSNGKLYFFVPAENDFQKATRPNDHLRVSNTDIIAKYGLAYNKTVTLTDEEKASALAWLGATSNSKTITYSTTGTQASGLYFSMYHQSNDTYSAEHLIGAELRYYYIDSALVATINQSEIKENTNDGLVIELPNSIHLVVAYKDNYAPSYSELSNAIFPKTGLYLGSSSNGVPLSMTINGTLDGKTASLGDNELIKSLMARIKALEAK